jgi:hypothetical protein
MIKFDARLTWGPSVAHNLSVIFYFVCWIQKFPARAYKEKHFSLFYTHPIPIPGRAFVLNCGHSLKGNIWILIEVKKMFVKDSLDTMKVSKVNYS